MILEIIVTIFLAWILMGWAFGMLVFFCMILSD